MNLTPLIVETRRSAELSPCGLYRYALGRAWEPLAGTVLFVMLNPSTADAEQDDATIRRCTGFTRAWGYGAFTVANLFAWRGTDPRELHSAHARGVDVIGPQNAAALTRLAALARRIVVAWGAHALRYPPHVDNVLQLLYGADDRAVYCLGLTADGAPRHPLRLARSTPLQVFR